MRLSSRITRVRFYGLPIHRRRASAPHAGLLQWRLLKCRSSGSPFFLRDVFRGGPIYYRMIVMNYKRLLISCCVNYHTLLRQSSALSAAPTARRCRQPWTVNPCEQSRITRVQQCRRLRRRLSTSKGGGYFSTD